MFVFVLLCITLCPFYFCNHLEEEEKASCLSLLSYRCTVTINVLWLFFAVPWVGMQCVIVIFPDILTYFLMGRYRYVSFMKSLDFDYGRLLETCSANSSNKPGTGFKFCNIALPPTT